MSTKKSPSFAIGAFIVGSIVLVFFALMFFSGGRLFADKEQVIMHFEGSVQGLQIGAPVKLKGVVLGEITDIQLNFQSDNQTVITAVTADLVMARINSMGANVNGEFLEEAVKNGLRAQLNFQSLLTGLLYVELDFYPDSPVKAQTMQKDLPEIPTIATSFEEITKNIQELDLKELVHNLNNLTGKIGEIVGNSEIQQAITNFNRAANSIDKTSTNLDREVTLMSKNVNSTLSELDTLLKQFNQQTPLLAESLEESLNELQKSLENFDEASANINHTFSEDGPVIDQLNTTLEDISRSAQAFRSLSETLEQQPEALLRGKKFLPERD
jgi:paraquat-inducible protein B